MLRKGEKGNDSQNPRSPLSLGFAFGLGARGRRRVELVHFSASLIMDVLFFLAMMFPCLLVSLHAWPCLYNLFRITRLACRRVQAPLAVRGFADKKDGGLGELFSKPSIPFGIGKFLGEESDHKIPTDKEHKSKVAHMPDFVPEDVRKDMKELGLDGIEDLDELELRNTDGYNDLGLVPPEGTGTFASPILIPSRRASRVVGYEDPDSHAMFWFTIHNDNNTYYIKDLGLFFKMLHIPDESHGHH